MKKLALFSLMFCLCGVYAVPAFAGNCGSDSLNFEGNQKYKDDEFIYEDEPAYLKAKEADEGSGSAGTATGWECDNDSCKHGSEQTFAAGHYFKGKEIKYEQTYKCTVCLTTGDCWEPVDKDNCIYKDSSGEQKMKAGEVISNKPFANLSSNCSLADGTLPSWATDAVAIKEVKSWKVECRKGKPTKKYCLVDKCNEGYVLNNSGRCVAKEGGKKCKFDGKEYNYGDVISQAACPDLKGNDYADLRTGKNCKKYCLLDKNTNKDMGVWSIETCPSGMTGVALTNANKFDPKASGYKKCVEKSNGGAVSQKNCKDKCGKSDTVCRACCDVIDTNEATYDSKAKKCNCLDGKEFKIDATSGNGQCVVKDVPPVVEGECDYYFTGSIECANGNQYFERKVVKLPKSKINKECGTDILKTDVAQVMELMKKLCEEKQPDIYLVPPKTGPSEREVEQAQSVLSAFTASAKDEASVWKTAEGKFNTTRLASDITAGVVLGTVGGVVTGNIIKKNQVKKGFEALHCTVGGQKVADWGDEFSVGLQR